MSEEIEYIEFIDSQVTSDFRKSNESASEVLTMANATTLETQYKSMLSSGKLPTLQRTKRTDVGDTKYIIEGFSFPACEIREALDSFTDNQGVHLSFGYDKDATIIGEIGLTIILTGIKADGTLHRVEGKIFDYSKPCPPRCPRLGFEIPCELPEGE